MSDEERWSIRRSQVAAVRSCLHMALELASGFMAESIEPSVEPARPKRGPRGSPFSGYFERPDDVPRATFKLRRVPSLAQGFT
jgi:hypothetical protein